MSGNHTSIWALLLLSSSLSTPRLSLTGSFRTMRVAVQQDENNLGRVSSHSKLRQICLRLCVHWFCPCLVLQVYLLFCISYCVSCHTHNLCCNRHTYILDKKTYIQKYKFIFCQQHASQITVYLPLQNKVKIIDLASEYFCMFIDLKQILVYTVSLL